jgi:hypothetical protein
VLYPLDGNYAAEIFNPQSHGLLYVVNGIVYSPFGFTPIYTLSQSVQMSAGDRLSGFMAFGTYELFSGHADSSYISINGNSIIY